ncbi:MAG TPA: hypothetical protein DD713_03975 [Nitrospiraceae bacterium]|nr:hypothetical protein [Nitrospiraceae bacterium]
MKINGFIIFLMIVSLLIGNLHVYAEETQLPDSIEDVLSSCEEESGKNRLERYLFEADNNEGETEMGIYAETMAQIEIDTEGSVGKLLDAKVKYPQSRHIQEALGWVYGRMYDSTNDKNKLAKAAEAFDRAETLYFENSIIKLYSGYADLMSKILVILKDKTRLDSYFAVLLERYPSDTIAHLSYAKALSSLSDNRAEKYFEKAISLKDEDNFQPTVDYVEHLLDRGYYKKALAVLNKEKSEAYYLHFIKGYTLEKLGRLKKAEEEYRRYLKFKEVTSFSEGVFKPNKKYRIPNGRLQNGIDFDADTTVSSAVACPTPKYKMTCSSTDWQCKMRTYAVWTINGEAERNNGTLGMMRAVAWNIRNRVFSPTSSVYCPSQFTCTNYAYCYPLSLVKWPNDPSTLYQRYFQVINTGGYAGLQFKTYTQQSEQVFFDVFNGLVPDPYSGKCPVSIFYGDSCSGTCGSTTTIWGSFPSYTTAMEFRAGRLYPKNAWGYQCYEFKTMGAPDMGNCTGVPCFVNSRLICPRYATQSDHISCYSDGKGQYYYTGPVYGNFFWSTNGGTN